MDRFDDRTPLWDYRDNSIPDDRGGGGNWDRGRAEDAARSYTAIEDNERRGRRGPDRSGEQAYRRDNWGDWYDADRSRSYSQRQSGWPSYERDNRNSRYYDAVGEARGGRGGSTGSIRRSEAGYPTSSYATYDDGRRPYHDDEGRGFFERAGDEVMSWFGDRDAQQRREQDHRGRGPKNYARSDDRIREDVNDRLTQDEWVDASEIEVAVEGGEVTLTGTVEDRRAKRRAEDCADAVSGVKHVQNNLRYTSGVTSQALG
jgi:osmotically-inducible protein OsmY